MVPPMEIALEFLRSPVHWPPSLFVPEENAAETPGDLPAHLKQVHHLSGTRGTFYPEAVAIIKKIEKERPDDESIDRNSDGAPPVGVAAEHAAVRFGRQILDLVFLLISPKRPRRSRP